MCLIRHRLSVMERLVGIRVVLWVRHQGGLVSKEDSRTGTLSFLGGSGGGFSGEGTALAFAVFPDERRNLSLFAAANTVSDGPAKAANKSSESSSQ